MSPPPSLFLRWRLERLRRASLLPLKKLERFSSSHSLSLALLLFFSRCYYLLERSRPIIRIERSTCQSPSALSLSPFCSPSPSPSPLQLSQPSLLSPITSK